MRYTLILFVLASLCAVSAQDHQKIRQTLPEVTSGKFNPDQYRAAQQDLHQQLSAVRPSLDNKAIISIEVSPAELSDLYGFEDSANKKSLDRDQRTRIGLTKNVGLGVDFTNLDPNNLPNGMVSQSNGVLRAGKNGGFVWTVGAESYGASGMRLHITDMDFPAGVSLYIYNEDGDAFGPYTGKGPNGNGAFWTNTVTGSLAFLQLHVNGLLDQRQLQRAGFTVAEAAHLGDNFAYAVMQKPAQHRKFCSFNADCVEDASCFNSNDWAHIDTVANGVAHMQYVSGAYIYICSGGLLADTDPNTQIPYFLTANHCISKGREANSLECFWQFRTNSCGGSCYDPSGVVPRTLGASILSSNRTSDYTLMELNQNPPSGSVFLGWTNQEVAFSNGTQLYRLSHPMGAPLAYSQHNVNTSAGTCTSWPRGSWIYSRDQVGATQGGSSGSPVLNGQGQVVGQLSGGCGTNINDDCDSQSNATVDGALAAYFSQVAQWLDPSDGGGDPGNGDFSLSVSTYKVKGVQHADLSWSGASGSNVDIYRDGSLIATTANDGSYTDNIGAKGSGSYSYQVCEAGSATCSSEVTATF